MAPPGDQCRDNGGAERRPGDVPEHERHAGSYQAKEKRPKQHGVVCQKVVEGACKQRDRQSNARDQGGQKTQVVAVPCGGWSFGKQRANSAPSQPGNGVEQFFVDTGDKGHRAATDARDQISSAHGHAPDTES